MYSGSLLYLFTINERQVAVETVANQHIRSLAMSSLDEGISINCVAAGLSNGVIRYTVMIQ